MKDEELIAKFEDATLPSTEFHHREHVQLAFLYLQRYPPLEALERFAVSLARFAAANDKPDLYNETVTWAFVLLIRERIARSGRTQLWEEFAQGNGDLLDWKNNILKNYYRDETLTSRLAKSTFILPDKFSR